MKKRLKWLIPWFILISIILVVFKTWFGFGEISAGDAAFYFTSTLKDFTFFPYIWFNTELGRYSSLLFSFPYLNFPIKLLSFLNVPWVAIERIVWYWPFLGLSIFSSWFLFKTVSPNINKFVPYGIRFSFLSPFIYLLNSYVLMIIGGGQISIALAYAIAPLVLGLFINLLTSSRVNELKSLIIVGVVLALQVSFEPRIAFITIIAVGIYLLLQLFSCELRIANLIKNLGIPFAITGLLHFYWILPSLVLRKTSFSPTLASGGWVEFLSFAQFSNSLSLLHPNWPENIFGKTYFMRPEFLILPILAFSSLLFINKLTGSRVKELKNSLINNSLITNKTILYFSLLGLLGAFLAKGSNPPFGEVYLWLFKYFPGMNMFRDPTKFYVLIAISYSVLIPYTVTEMYNWLKRVVNSKQRTVNRKLMSDRTREPNILVTKADVFVHRIYAVTRKFSQEEMYGVTSQVRRSALSIILNTIEGFARQNSNEHRRFLDIAYGSLKETKYLLYFSYKEDYLSRDEYEKLIESSEELGKMIWSKRESLRKK